MIVITWKNNQYKKKQRKSKEISIPKPSGEMELVMWGFPVMGLFHILIFLSLSFGRSKYLRLSLGSVLSKKMGGK